MIIMEFTISGITYSPPKMVWAPFHENPETFRVHIGWHHVPCIFTRQESWGMKVCSYFNFYSLDNFWKDQLYRMSRLKFDKVHKEVKAKLSVWSGLKCRKFLFPVMHWADIKQYWPQVLCHFEKLFELLCWYKGENNKKATANAQGIAQPPWKKKEKKTLKAFFSNHHWES